MSNVFAAIQNRDAGALARMMGPDNHQAQQDNVVNISAERLVDALFKQLKQLFPAAEQTNLKTAQCSAAIFFAPKIKKKCTAHNRAIA